MSLLSERAAAAIRQDAASLHLWIARTDQIVETPELALLLEPYEKLAQQRFVRAVNRHEYFVTRLLARMALAAHLDTGPADLRFIRTAEGRPQLVRPTALQFNLSNTAGLVVCLVATARDVGIDVEACARGPAIVDLADTVFTESERAALFARHAGDRLHYATMLWTLKESYIKARGKGMALPLLDIAFHIGTSTTVELAPSLEDDAQRWWFHTRAVGKHLVSMCVSCEREDPPNVLEHDLAAWLSWGAAGSADT